MQENEPSPPPRKLAKTATPIKRLWGVVSESFLEIISPAGPLLRYIKKEGRGVKEGWHLFIVILAVALFGMHWLDSSYLTSSKGDNSSMAEEKNRKAMIREGVGKFLKEGMILQGKCSNHDAPVPVAELKQWRLAVDAFLSSNLGNSYVVRLDDASDSPPLYTDPDKEDKAHIEARSWITVRVFNLKQILKEI